MKLFLNTTSFDNAVIGIKETGAVVAEREVLAGKSLSQNLLKEIDLLLGENNFIINEVTAIEVATKSQNSFTGTRVGISVANTLGYALGVPVNGEKLATAEYEKEPNIGNSN